MSNSLAIGTGTGFRRAFGRRERAASVAAASTLKHIFVIAGPSGSGKSTFMGEFVFGRLPINISRDLPQGSKTWLRTSGNELSRKGLSRVLRGKGVSEGLVVHYDIMRAYSRGFEHFANDPAMQAVTEAKAALTVTEAKPALTVLTVLPPREVLLEQFLRRARNGEYEEWWDRKRLIRPLKHKLRMAFHRITKRSPKLLKEYHLGLLEVYCSDQGLSLWTKRWEAFLDGVQRDRGDVRLVYVAPEPLQGGHPRFRRLRSI
jgi:hypothetical protein